MRVSWAIAGTAKAKAASAHTAAARVILLITSPSHPGSLAQARISPPGRYAGTPECSNGNPLASSPADELPDLGQASCLVGADFAEGRDSTFHVSHRRLLVTGGVEEIGEVVL